MRAVWLLSLLTLPLLGCPEKPKPPPPEEERSASGVPQLNQAFLTKAFGVGTALANTPLVAADIDSRMGTEAMIALHSGGKDYQVAVVRADQTVLSRAPLGGKILAHAAINFVGEFKVSTEVLPDGAKAYLMPVETTVYHRAVCGILAFRYRRDSLSLVGEFSSKCWRKEAGGDGGDPFRFMKVSRQGDVVLVTTEEEQDETRVYRWDAGQSAFVSTELGRKKK